MTLRRPRGFTAVELAIVLGIVAVLSAAAWASLSRLRPRARLAGSATELRSLLYGARQAALATGHDVVVMLFPRFGGPEGTGKIVVYEDGDFALFNPAAPLNFDGYDPGQPAAGPRSQVISTHDFPPTVVVGPAGGAGTGAALVAPLAGIPIDVDCSFCGNQADRRGAIRFDPRGRAFFHPANGLPQAGVRGGSLSLASERLQGQVTLVVLSSTGAARTIVNR